MNLRKLLAAWILLAAAPAAYSQFETASVLGSVADQRGAAISECQVVLQNLDTGVLQKAKTDASGVYPFLEVRVGKYKVTAEAQVDLGYAGNHGVALWVNADLNQALPNASGQSLPLKTRRTDAQFDYIDSNFSAGFSSYHALQAKLEKRYSRGLTLLNSFTWSKAIDNASGALEMSNGDQQSLNLFNFQSSKGLSGYDQPFNNATSAVWELPIGRGRRYGANMPVALDAIAGGWALSGINTMTSGQTINLTYDPNAAFIATDGSKNSAVYRPNITGDPMMPDGQRTINQYFNPNTVVVPTDPSHPYGNAGRNIGRSNAYFNLDFGIHKQFRSPGEGRNLEFRTEFFNTLNKTNFSPANGDRSSSSFGTITGTFPARQVQFALRLMF